MGTYTHKPVVVISQKGYVEAAHKKAVSLFPDSVSPVINSDLNGWGSFLIATDGSKDGWEDQELADCRRSLFKDWINAQAFADGSNMYTYVEVVMQESSGNVFVNTNFR